MKQGWEIKRLGELCENLDSMRIPITKSQRKVGEFPYYGASGIVDYVDDYLFNENLLCISEDGANLLARTYPIAFSINGKSWVNNHAHVLKFSNIVTQKFVEMYINSISIEQYVSGMAQPKLNQAKLNSIQIPIPPLPEQERIVGILDRCFEAIDKAIANTEQNLRNTKELFESYLNAIFTNKSDDWEEKRLGEVAETNGRIGWKGLTAKEYTEEGPLFLSVHSLNYGMYVDFRDAFHISQSRFDESPEIQLKTEDILICKDGAGIGKLGIVPILKENVTINSSLLLIRCTKIVIPKYLYFNLLSPLFQNIVKSRLSGATTPHLYQRDINTFPIQVPSIKKQQQIVSKLDKLRAETERMETIYRKKIADLHELKKSILQKAFAGELNTEEVKG